MAIRAWRRVLDKMAKDSSNRSRSKQRGACCCVVSSRAVWPPSTIDGTMSVFWDERHDKASCCVRSTLLLTEYGRRALVQ